MLPTLLALALAAAEPLALPPPALAAEPPVATAPVPSAPLAATRAAAAPAVPAPPLQLPSPTPGLATFALPALALLALAAAAFLASRRQRAAPRLVKLIETTSLGPKRSLAVARLGEELLVLAVSEAGVQLLATRPAGPATAVPAAPERQPEPRRLRPVAGPVDPLEDLAASVADAEPVDLSDLGGPADDEAGQAAAAIREAGQDLPAGRLRALFGRLADRGARAVGGAPRRPAPSFDALLAESAEDQELRRKLSQGLAGSVR